MEKIIECYHQTTDASLAKKILKKIEKRSAKLIAEIKKNNHAN
jgi:hypothetical protein